jgi:hypothetical protein
MTLVAKLTGDPPPDQRDRFFWKSAAAFYHLRTGTPANHHLAFARAANRTRFKRYTQALVIPALSCPPAQLDIALKAACLKLRAV